MLRIGLKYCGGCSAQFDRVALVTEIKKRLSQEIVFVSFMDKDADLILVVAGCESACVDLTQFEGKEVFVIFRKEHAETFVEKIRSMESS